MQIAIAILLTIWVNILFAQDISIKSNPEHADVYFVSEAGKKITVGKTPYSSPLAMVSSFQGGGATYTIEVIKDGFEPYRIIIPSITNGEINLFVNLEIDKNIKMTREFDQLVTELFDVQRMVRTKDTSSAKRKLVALEKKFPHFSVVYEMLGSVEYLEKNYSKSLSMYRKAYSVNPENRDAFKMMTYLEKKFNIHKAGTTK